MGKQYAYCPNGYVLEIETRTERDEGEYPIAKYYHSAFLPFFQEIPEHQKGLVQRLWIWDATQHEFREPQTGEEINGEIYLGKPAQEAEPYEEITGEVPVS